MLHSFLRHQNPPEEKNMIEDQESAIHQKVIEGFNGDIEEFIQRRKAKGFSQKALAKALGFFDAAVIGHFETKVFNLDSRSHTLFLLITDFHPRYKLKKKDGVADGDLLVQVPSGKKIRATRIKANAMTQLKMARLLELSGKTIISKYENEQKSPSVTNWTVFLLLSNQHPFYELAPVQEAPNN